jgi:hypothetical protein
MLDDFMRALARVQSDYSFYIGCQANPALALEGYSLSPDERLALTDPEKLADVFSRRVGMDALPRITITISGKHDWVNRAASAEGTVEKVNRDAMVVLEVEAIKRASTDEQRTKAAIRLMGLIG